VGAPELLALARDLYDSLPATAMLLTIGAGSTELGEEFSEPVLDAIPQACALLERQLWIGCASKISAGSLRS